MQFAFHSQRKRQSPAHCTGIATASTPTGQAVRLLWPQSGQHDQRPEQRLTIRQFGRQSLSLAVPQHYGRRSLWLTTGHDQNTTSRQRQTSETLSCERKTAAEAEVSNLARKMIGEETLPISCPVQTRASPRDRYNSTANSERLVFRAPRAPIGVARTTAAVARRNAAVDRNISDVGHRLPSRLSVGGRNIGHCHRRDQGGSHWRVHVRADN